MKKVCSKCRAEKPLTNKYFRVKKKKPNNIIVEYWDYWCIECSNDYANQWMKKRNKLVKENDPTKYNILLLNHRVRNRKHKNESIRNISNTYLAFILGIKTKDLKKYPEKFIKAKKTQIQLHRHLYPNHKNIKTP